MKDAIELFISGIKCDACDYRDDSVKVEDYPEWVNKPCPKCGANLLTEADFNSVQLIVQMTNLANQALPKLEESEPEMIATGEMDGTGHVHIKIYEDDDEK
jgi:hypothetical protein